MSLNAAFNAASSGLKVTSRGTQVIADNIANASTEGYVARTLVQTANNFGDTSAGVRITGIARNIPQALVEDMRNGLSRSESAGVVTEFWRSLERVVGLPGSPDSLGAALLSLDANLTRAATTPESTSALMLAAHAAKDVTQALREISKFLTEEKARINNSISNDIAALNASLESVAQLNDEIVKVNLRRGDPSTFLDQRQRIVDSIAKIIPIKEIQRDFGRITLAASDGRLLLDRTMTYLDARASTVSLSLDEATGFKNVIYINGEALARDSKLLEGSKLGSLQHISEVEIPRVQKIIDNVANTLIKQFSQRNVDPTLREGEDGLFTASESHINSPSSVGLAGRIALSPYLDPNRPEDLWRLRDGLNAEAPGPKGSSLILSKMIEALNSSSSLSEPGGLNQDIYSHVSDIGAEISTNRMQSDLLGARLMARAEVLRQSVATFGVDSDAELQKLLLLEKHFSANAKIISSIDEMLRTIIAI